MSIQITLETLPHWIRCILKPACKQHANAIARGDSCGGSHSVQNVLFQSGGGGKEYDCGWCGKGRMTISGMVKHLQETCEHRRVGNFLMTHMRTPKVHEYLHGRFPVYSSMDMILNDGTTIDDIDRVRSILVLVVLCCVVRSGSLLYWYCMYDDDIYQRVTYLIYFLQTLIYNRHS